MVFLLDANGLNRAHPVTVAPIRELGARLQEDTAVGEGLPRGLRAGRCGPGQAGDRLARAEQLDRFRIPHLQEELVLGAAGADADEGKAEDDEPEATACRFHRSPIMRDPSNASKDEERELGRPRVKTQLATDPWL